MLDYGYLNERSTGDVNISDEQASLSAWFGWLDMMLISLMARQDVINSSDNGRVGYRTPRNRVMEAMLPGEDTAPFPKERMRDYYQVLMQAGEMYLAEADGITLWTLVYSEQLQPVEVVALLLAAAPEVDRKYETVFDVLTGTGHDGTATVGLVYDICNLFLTPEEIDSCRLFESSGFVMDYLIAPDEEEHTHLTRKLKLHPYAYRAMLSPLIDYGTMALFAEILRVPSEKETVLREEAYNRLLRLMQKKDTGLVVLAGAEGSGKKYLAAKAAGELQQILVKIRMEELLTLENKDLYEVLDEMVFRYLLYGDTYYLEAGDLSRFSEDRLQLVFSKLIGGMRQVILGTEKSPEHLYLRGETVHITLDRIERSSQAVLWKEIAAREDITFAKNVDLSELVSKFDLLPGRIEEVLHTAALGAKPTKTGKITVAKELIEAEINRKSEVQFGTLASRIQTSFTREDIYLTEIAKKEVDRVLARIRYRSVVNEGYGFGRNLPYGRGVSVVLYGPPGTGKTMLASVIANELNLSLYRIDLSQMSSKYIGETEKNIAGLFAAARNSNGILFFDEADALFAKRTEVSGSNDRYANAETAFLLQQIEAYDGLSILATNAMQNFDSAFKRRMTFMIPMERPNEEERLELWKHIFPKDVPLEKDVHFDIFAKKAELTGSAIKAAALDAAYTAAARGDKVSMQDLIDAVDLQCRRNGITGVGAELMMER